MRHRVKSKRLNRPKDQLYSMLANLTVSVILYEKIKTTQAKAKLVRSMVDKMITIAKKKEPIQAVRALNQALPDPNAVKKLLQELKVRYKDRPSGFTRTTKIGFRVGDAAPMARIELIQ